MSKTLAELDRESLDIRDLDAMAASFEQKLLEVKQRAECDWYPYRSLSNFSLLDRLLKGDHRSLLKLAGGGAVLDLGCADGDLAFFLETLGLEVDAVDYAATNHNRMEGVNALKSLLDSRVSIHSVDLDMQFVLPREHYGLTFFLGLLYHLKNPIYVLERLAECSEYCLLSTRIAASSPGGRGDLRKLPVAYLLDEGEANQDNTNYWIFSEPGLQRLIRRTGWEIADYITIGDDAASDPVSAAADQRAFCLLRSRWIHPLHVELADGWHRLEFGSWRWTERVFRVDLTELPAARSVLTLQFHIPDDLFRRVERPVTLHAIANGVVLPSQIYSTAGDQIYRQSLPEQVKAPCHVEFVLDKALPPNATDRRELGVLVCFARDKGRERFPITVT